MGWEWDQPEVGYFAMSPDKSIRATSVPSKWHRLWNRVLLGWTWNQLGEPRKSPAQGRWYRFWHRRLVPVIQKSQPAGHFETPEKYHIPRDDAPSALERVWTQRLLGWEWWDQFPINGE